MKSSSFISNWLCSSVIKSLEIFFIFWWPSQNKWTLKVGMNIEVDIRLERLKNKNPQTLNKEISVSICSSVFLYIILWSRSALCFRLGLLEVEPLEFTVIYFWKKNPNWKKILKWQFAINIENKNKIRWNKIKENKIK